MKDWFSIKEMKKEFAFLQEKVALISQKLRDENATLEDVTKETTIFNVRVRALEEREEIAKKRHNIYLLSLDILTFIIAIVNIIFNTAFTWGMLISMWAIVSAVSLNSIYHSKLFVRKIKELKNSFNVEEGKELMGEKYAKFVRSRNKAYDEVKIKATIDEKQVEGRYLDSNMRPINTTRELNDYELALWTINFYMRNHTTLMMPDHINKIIIKILQEDLNTEEDDLDKLLAMLDWHMQNDHSSEFNLRRQKYKRRF